MPQGDWHRQCPCDFLGIQEGIVPGQASGIGLGGFQLWRPSGCGDSGGSGTSGLLELLHPTISIPSCFPASAMLWVCFSPDLDAQLLILLLIIVFARRGQYL